MSQQLPLDELTLTLARIRGLLLTEEKVDRAVQLLAEGVRDAFPGSAGAGVSLIDEQGNRTSAGATDPLVIQGDQSQYRLGEGPCLSAWATEQTVIVSNAGADDRWPAWAESARELNIASVISAPLIRGPRCFGAMKLYSAAGDAYDQNTAGSLEKLAASAAILLDNIQSTETPKRFSEGLVEALNSRDSISRAQGYLMGQRGLTEEEAVRELLNLSQESKKSLAAVSAEILGGGRRDRVHEGT
ncbi:GAF and ANTAR domain-containing protein [Paenarthrobacter aurescens]|uniref:Transcriptional regulator n=2 Tax=Paenarthrobacter aurescens TaxID=43663 RepID=A0A4Y3N966_PAEAU|nr:GAF and ANTAR domain-containing protein [Paenarthrobacter aurescens]MDO6159683.1 GAF and ANTAR domain-containing protein [Paenarthrobacter aurescens]GEB17747.1 transcriptional regulator [Paenarthrobacter aurescens]